MLISRIQKGKEYFGQRLSKKHLEFMSCPSRLYTKLRSISQSICINRSLFLFSLLSIRMLNDLELVQKLKHFSYSQLLF